MTPERLVALAQRNSALRRGQINRLRPAVAQARAKSDELRQEKEGAKKVKAGIEQMAKLKWVPNFFPTPRKIIHQMIALADIMSGMQILEPSAGKADIALAMRDLGCEVTCIERVPALAEIIRGHGFGCECSDFLELRPNPFFDRVMMNPPFERGIDEDHILHAFKFLKPGGRLIAVACSTTGIKLAEWADQIIDLPAGSFVNSERSTQVNTCLIMKYS